MTDRPPALEGAAWRRLEGAMPWLMAAWAFAQWMVFGYWSKDLEFDHDANFGPALLVVATVSTLLLVTYLVLTVGKAHAAQGQARWAWGLSAAVPLVTLPWSIFFFSKPDDSEGPEYVCHRWGFIPVRFAEA